jgi:hypothetical protein
VLWLLGVEEPDSWDGDAIVDAFKPVSAATD